MPLLPIANGPSTRLPSSPGGAAATPVTTVSTQLQATANTSISLPHVVCDERGSGHDLLQALILVGRLDALCHAPKPEDYDVDLPGPGEFSKLKQLFPFQEQLGEGRKEWLLEYLKGQHQCLQIAFKNYTAGQAEAQAKYGVEIPDLTQPQKDAVREFVDSHWMFHLLAFHRVALMTEQGPHQDFYITPILKGRRGTALLQQWERVTKEMRHTNAVTPVGIIFDHAGIPYVHINPVADSLGEASSVTELHQRRVDWILARITHDLKSAREDFPECEFPELTQGEIKRLRDYVRSPYLNQFILNTEINLYGNKRHMDAYLTNIPCGPKGIELKAQWDEANAAAVRRSPEDDSQYFIKKELDKRSIPHWHVNPPRVAQPGSSEGAGSSVPAMPFPTVSLTKVSKKPAAGVAAPPDLPPIITSDAPKTLLRVAVHEGDNYARQLKSAPHEVFDNLTTLIQNIGTGTTSRSIKGIYSAFALHERGQRQRRGRWRLLVDINHQTQEPSATIYGIFDTHKMPWKEWTGKT